MGSERILLYTLQRSSFTMPVEMGTITAFEPK